MLHFLLLLITALVWGIAFVAQEVGAQHVGPFTFLSLRSWIALAVVLPFVALYDRHTVRTTGKSSRPATAEQKRALVTGSICVGFFLFAGSVSQQIGIADTTAGKSGFITVMYVVIVPVASIFLGMRPSWRIWICVALGVAGLYLLCVSGGMSVGFGDAVTMLCALFFSCQILTINHFLPRVNGMRLACGEFLVTATLATIGMLLFDRPTIGALYQARWSILYAGVMSSGVGYTCQIIGQRGLNPTLASLTMCLESVFSALAGWLLLHQTMSPRELTGCMLMFAAIVLSQLLN